MNLSYFKVNSKGNFSSLCSLKNAIMTLFCSPIFLSESYALIIYSKRLNNSLAQSYINGLTYSLTNLKIKLFYYY